MLLIRLIWIFVLLHIINAVGRYRLEPLSHQKPPNKRQLYRYWHDLEELPSFKDDHACGSSNSKSSSSCGIGRGDPKTKATNIAQKAAVEAKAANDAQVAAAEAAATQVRTELAAKAAQSARAAEAALAGKQQILEQLQQEAIEAEAVVQEVNTALHSTQTNAQNAGQAAQEAQNQLRDLKNLITALSANLGNIENVAHGMQQELAEKLHLLEAAKNRVEMLNRQVHDAQQDFDKTKAAAYRAACAAVEAKQKAYSNGT